MPLSWPIEAKCTNGQDAASRVCGVSSSVFLGCFVIFVMTSAVAGGSVAFVVLRCCGLLLADNFQALLVIIVLGVVDGSFVFVFFYGKDTFRLSRLRSSTSSPETWYLVFSDLLFANRSSRLSCLEYHDWRKRSPLDGNVAHPSARDAPPASHALSLTYLIFPCVLLERKPAAYEKELN